MKRINRDGPRVLERSAPPSRLAGGALRTLLASGATVVDIRPAAAYAARHVPGTINIPWDRSFTTWAGWLLPYDHDFHLLVGDLDVRGMGDLIADLATIGLDRLAGYFTGDAIDVWEAEGGTLGTVPQWTPADLARRRAEGDVAVIDVRWAQEWDAGHLPDTPNVPVPELLARIAELPDSPVVVLHCQGGGRSSIAASLLHAAGRQNVVNLAGGYRAWAAAGLPVVAEPD
jgi:hydroxyacylglutathione hydrolase